MFKVKTINNIHDIGLSQLRQRGYTLTGEGDDQDAIIVRSADMHDSTLNSNLLCIARAGAGTNNIPIDRCTDAGIVVFNTPGANAEAVKEITICAMLLASRDIVGGMQWVGSIAGQSGIPALVESEKSRFAGPEIKGKSLGVIGLGAIGALVANVALDLGMNVYGYDPYLSVSSAWRLSSNIINALDLDTIFTNCDYITLHVPYIPETAGMINAEAISKMRTGVRIINMARGELVVDADILEAVTSKKVACYVTDFPNDSLTGVPGVVAFPHIGASTPESEENCAAMAAAQTIEYLENGNIINSVNFPSVRLNRNGASRICVMHDKPMITNLLDIIRDSGNHIENMTSTHGDSFMYTLIDTQKKLDDDIKNTIISYDGVIRARII